MKIISNACISLFNSSYSAFKLARAAQNDLNLANKILSVKSKGAHERLGKLKKDSAEYDIMKLKSQKYDNLLNRVKNIQETGKDICSLS
ncbi:hypothetical protein [uncultured Cedecea sp.]|uniref:hypothetical protein n=1 Tax=uncultured Cedecea sp. TaxID=988762 RepID=UPI00262FD10A|nr:hypothetical protein [uncultured Cedecea sp.]